MTPIHSSNIFVYRHFFTPLCDVFRHFANTPRPCWLPSVLASIKHLMFLKYFLIVRYCDTTAKTIVPLFFWVLHCYKKWRFCDSFRGLLLRRKYVDRWKLGKQNTCFNHFSYIRQTNKPCFLSNNRTIEIVRQN